MRTLSPDTTPAAEAVQLDLLRKATPAQRFARTRSLSQTTIALARRALQRRHPGATDTDIEFVAMYYGEDLARCVRLALEKAPR